MKNLSVREKKDLELCVFENLTEKKTSVFLFFPLIFRKIRAFFTPSNKA
ncbi:hypothetical protein [Campylobacter sp.]